MTFAGPLVGLVVILCAAPQGPRRAGDHAVEVTCDVDDARIRSTAQAVAEESWRQTCALWGVDPSPPEKPVELHLYREIADYEKACDRLMRGRLKRNLAFTEWAGGTAHIVLQPVMGGDALKSLAPTFQTLRLVAHETAHVTRRYRLPNCSSQPDWLTDGTACWLETKVLAAKLLLASPERAPHFSTQEVAVQRMLTRKQLPSVEALVHDRTETLAFFDRYAASYLLVRFLAEGARAKVFRDFLGDVAQLGGGPGFVDQSAEALAKRLGVRDLAALDDEFHAFIDALKPEWDEPGFSLSVQGEEWTQAAFDDSNAVAFRTARAGAKRYAVEGEVTTVADLNATPQANVLLGRESTTNDASLFVSVAIVPGAGVTVFSFDGTQAGNDQWRQLGTANNTETSSGKPLRFAVECEPQGRQTRVAVRLAGRAILEVTADRPLDGSWGVGVQHGCSCIWKGVRQTPGGSR